MPGPGSVTGPAPVTDHRSGIGEAAANVLASDGGAVVVADVDDAGGARVVAEVEAAGGKAAFIHTDVSQERQAEAMVKSPSALLVN